MDRKAQYYCLGSLVVLILSLNLIVAVITPEFNTSSEYRDVSYFYDEEGMTRRDFIDSNSTSSQQEYAQNSTLNYVYQKNTVLEAWKNIQDNLKIKVDRIVRQFLPELIKLGSEVNISKACTFSVLRWFRGIKNLSSWAVKMIDSSGRIPSGILSGTFSDLGSYDDCLDITATDGTKNVFQGQYCTIMVRPPLPPKPSDLTLHTEVIPLTNPMLSPAISDVLQNARFFYLLKFRFGVCVPSVCSQDDVQHFVSTALKELRVNVQVPHCVLRERFIMTTAQIVIISVFSFVLLLMVMGTILDTAQSSFQETVVFRPSLLYNVSLGRLIAVVKAFSVFTNGKKWLAIYRPSQSLAMIHGLRFLSMTWIILGHTYTVVNLYAYKNLKELQDAPKNIPFNAVLNGWLAVDSFFFIGGLTLAYTTLQKLENTGGKFYILRFVCHRYWRLVPPLAATIGLLLLLPLVSSGPLWYDFVTPEVEKCQRNWWANLLFISNWRPVDEICLPPTWYLCCDMQIHLASVAVIIMLYRRPVIGLAMNSVLMVASIAVLTFITLWNGFLPSVVHVTPDVQLVKNMALYIHWQPYTHMAPYGVGTVVGYIYLRKEKLRFRQVTRIIGWTAAVACNMAALYGAYEWNNGRKATLVVTILYASCHRLAWSLGLAWMTYMCLIGHGGFINSFLSWKPFIPLSRLTYMSYLIHSLVMFLRIGSLRETFHFNHYDQVYLFVGHLAFTLAAAVVGYLAFELPFAALEKTFFKDSEPNKESSAKTGECTPNESDRK